MLESTTFSLGLLTLITLLLILPSLRKLPGVGILPTILIIAVVLWARGDALVGLGLLEPESWQSTIGLSLVCGSLLALTSAMLIEPFTERWTKSEHDLSALGTIQGNLRATIMWVIGAWLMAATLEEIIFRGFYMRELARILGTGTAANVFNVISTSTIFGLAHWYQSRAGALSTGIISVFLGALFIWNDFNLWLLILTHGVIDTVGLTILYMGWDERLKHTFIGRMDRPIEKDIVS
jgi:membrane protease YdiL (CAAX protease family)